MILNSPYHLYIQHKESCSQYTIELVDNINIQPVILEGPIYDKLNFFDTSHY